MGVSDLLSLWSNRGGNVYPDTALNFPDGTLGEIIIIFNFLDSTLEDII